MMIPSTLHPRALTLLALILALPSLPAAAQAVAAPAPAPGAIEHRTAATHPMQYDVSLPRGWTAQKKWPVVVVITDAHRNFRENLEAFVAARGERPFILVAPYNLTAGGGELRKIPTLSYPDDVWVRIEKDTPCGFDLEGLAAVISDVEARFGGEARARLTGWEAGGHTAWAMLFAHPELLAAVALVDSNYAGRCVAPRAAKLPPDRTALPIRLLQADGEPSDFIRPMVEQSHRAQAAAKARGFRKVSWKLIPDAKNGPLPGPVLEFFSQPPRP